MKMSKDTKALTIAAVASGAALFAMLSTSINAGQYPHYGYKGYGYDRYYQPPAPPGYMYYQPGMHRSMQGYQHGMGEAGGATGSGEKTEASGQVGISAMQFQPATVRVKAGDTVTWVNQEAMPHTITSPNNGLLASERLNRGGSYEHTFKETGTYVYYCSLHPSMTGKVIVE